MNRRFTIFATVAALMAIAVVAKALNPVPNMSEGRYWHGTDQGTINTQAAIDFTAQAPLTLTSIGAASTAYSYFPPAASAGYCRAECVARAVVAPTGGATGDRIVARVEGDFKNVAGTVSVSSSSSTTIGTPDTSMSAMLSSFSWVAGTGSVILQLSEGGSNPGTVDYLCTVHFTVD